MGNLATITPENLALTWLYKFNAAHADWKTGVNSVSENPCEKAANASGKWLQNVQASQEKFESSLRRVSLSDWKSACGDVTPAGWSKPQGGAAQTKMREFAAKLIPKLKSVVTEIEALPSVTPMHMRDRMLKYFDLMSGWNPNT